MAVDCFAEHGPVFARGDGTYAAMGRVQPPLQEILINGVNPHFEAAVVAKTNDFNGAWSVFELIFDPRDTEQSADDGEVPAAAEPREEMTNDDVIVAFDDVMGPIAALASVAYTSLKDPLSVNMYAYLPRGWQRIS